MRKMSEELTSATAEANKLFGQMSEMVQKRVDEGAVEINVAEVAREAGLEIDDRIIEELQIDRVILVHPWLPWHCWWPWRPLWCWWWRRYYPWYHCCRWWWHRCHWYPD
jgi:hypothetical protein